MGRSNRTPAGIKEKHGIKISVDDIVNVTDDDAFSNFSVNEKVIMINGKSVLSTKTVFPR